MDIKILYLTEAKITIGESGNWRDQGDSTVIHWIFVLLSKLRFKSQSDVILFFFTVHVKVHKC